MFFKRKFQLLTIGITDPLTKLNNASLRCGSIPSDWKKSNVTAVHKSGCKDDPSNFRPISRSVVPILAKILKKLVASQLSINFEQHQLLSQHQGAYHTGRSIE